MASSSGDTYETEERKELRTKTFQELKKKLEVDRNNDPLIFDTLSRLTLATKGENRGEVQQLRERVEQLSVPTEIAIESKITNINTNVTKIAIFNNTENENTNNILIKNVLNGNEIQRLRIPVSETNMLGQNLTLQKCIAWSKNNNMIALSYYKDLNIYSIDTRSLIYTFKCKGIITNIYWSPNNKEIAIKYHSFSKNNIDILSIENSTIRTPEFENVATYLDWSSNGDMIAIQCGYRIYIYNTNTLQIIHMELGTNPFRTIKWSPNNEYLAIYADDSIRHWTGNVNRNLIKILSINDWKVITSIDINQIEMADIIEWSMNSEYLIIVKKNYGTRNSIINIYSIPTGTLKKTFTIQNYINEIKLDQDMNNIICITSTPNIDVNNLILIPILLAKFKGGNKEKYKYKGRLYKIYIGNKGGKYICVGKEKIKHYIK